MADYRFGKDNLLETLTVWDEILSGRGKIRLIACGGTALTLLGYKESTKDVDFLVPVESEYRRLVRFLRKAGYRQVTSFGWNRAGNLLITDLYAGKRVYTTELLSSPLQRGGNRKVWEGKKVYLGVLNPIDLVISKMFRGSSVDQEDCLTLVRHEELDLRRLEERYRETAKYHVDEERLLRNWMAFRNRLHP